MGKALGEKEEKHSALVILPTPSLFILYDLEIKAKCVTFARSFQKEKTTYIQKQ